MLKRLKTLFESLGFRLLVLLLVTVGTVLTAHAIISFRSTKADLLRFVRADVDRSSDLIRRATHDGMLLNRKEEVQATIERLVQGPEIAAIRVYDKDGVTQMSARRDEIGERIDPDSETCQSCHEMKQPGDTAVVERRGLSHGEGPDVLRHLTVIQNEPSCAKPACHPGPERQRVLGVLDVEMSLGPLDAAVRKAQAHLLWTTLALSLIVGVVVAVFIRRVVQRPVQRLYEGTRRIAEGDLDTRIEVRGRHELARLARAFNQMAVDLRNARREITEFSEKLEEKIIEKTEELGRAQRQVLQMEKMASLGRLSATVAHELNNPLSGMLVYARLARRELEEQPLEDAVRADLTGYLSMVEQECARCGGIVQNLLLFARRSGAALAAADVNDIVERSLMLVRPRLEGCGIRLCRERLDGDAELLADAAQLQQAIVALLVNAIEALSEIAEDRRQLTVCVRGDPDAVCIEVADTGIGIPEESLAHVFEPFFSTKPSGVGLGLAVVYGIVQRHGGRVEVDSHYGEGARFRLHLPRRPPPGATPEAGE